MREKARKRMVKIIVYVSIGALLMTSLAPLLAGF